MNEELVLKFHKASGHLMKVMRPDFDIPYSLQFNFECGCQYAMLPTAESSKLANTIGLATVICASIRREALLHEGWPRLWLVTFQNEGFARYYPVDAPLPERGSLQKEYESSPDTDITPTISTVLVHRDSMGLPEVGHVSENYKVGDGGEVVWGELIQQNLDSIDLAQRSHGAIIDQLVALFAELDGTEQS